MRTGAHFRGVLEWLNDGIPLGTQSNEAARLYDAAVSQYVGWYDDANMGGLEATIKKMVEVDPTFVGGRALELGLQVMSTQSTTRLDKQLESNLNHLKQLSERVNVPFREKKHVEAVLSFAKGDLYGAALSWEDVLLEHPTDIAALNMASTTYFFLGRQFELRDSVARVLPYWTSTAIPLKSYLHGMYAFGLCETNFYAKAEREALKGLEREPRDGWAAHALAHVYEMEGRADEGIAFMGKTENDWKICNHLASHNYWHWALYHIEKSELDVAGDIFENEVLKRALESKTMFNLVDLTSLQFRMQLENPAVTHRYIGKHRDTVSTLIEPYLNDHILAFNDAHMMMALVGAKKYSQAEELIENAIKEPTISGKPVVEPLLRGILEYGRGNYSEAVDLLNPIRYEITQIGGSDAQRDIFKQLLICAALKSPKNGKLVEHLVIERQAYKDLSPLTDRYSLKLSSQI
ncbi:Tetratricopeptide repeat protein 38 [Halotydeus destructor]|nr:Tetratricopeptide repeat protein 38 [Halotydeus destructor]